MMQQTSIMADLDARYKFDNPWHRKLQISVLDSTFTVRWMGGWVGGWLDQSKIKQISVPAGLKLELVTELGKI